MLRECTYKQLPPAQPDTPYKFHVYYSSPYVVCLKSLVEIRSAVLEKSPVKDERRAQVPGWVQTRQRYSGMAWPILCGFHHPIHNLSSLNQTALFFENFPRLIAVMLDVVWPLVHPKSHILLPT